MAIDGERILDVARQVFGFERLRPGQREAVEAVLAGRDTLVVMPTGAGKSAVYQIAALLIDGPTVVVSPLIALQRDQVAGLSDHGVTEASEANSMMSGRARSEAFDDLVTGDLEFLFLAPEQFGNSETRQRLREAQPSLFVVDEAHCISAWGHDFRPDYLRLGAVADELGRPVILALTATAAPPVRAEIVERLQLRDPEVIVCGYDRPNLRLAVELFDDERVKTERLLELVEQTPGSGLVYVATRRAATTVAEQLRDRDVNACAYHAGLRKSERNAVQRAFMEDEVRVVVATVAFGMGIDKSDVRFVYHYAISDSVDSYYQEIGRAGRDGEPSEAGLLYRPQDVGLRRFFAASAPLEADEVEQVADTVADHDGHVSLEQLQDATDLSQSKLTSAVSQLEKAGALTVQADGAVVATEELVEPSQAAQAAAEVDEARRKLDESRVAMMRSYAETRDCRRAFLLNYFGESYEPPCGNCDNCLAGLVEPDDHTDEPFPLNSRVVHPEWGEGLVMRYEDSKVVVLFDEQGYRTLLLDAVAERDLLAPAD